ncbi:MAG: helix-turn-helix domain-containing protein [Treponema sp.]|jgi:AraC-like DNA-binding protein/ligand-binding sensor protein|nr:helix-turn-helix domain-containing protein [Treponema sp.]
MKKDTETGVNNQSSTDPILLKAYKLLKAYAKATGTMICVHDHNCLPIPEIFDTITTEKNTCLFCLKYRANTIVHTLRDLTASPCNEMHIKAIREAHHYGGSYIYMCDLGFVFWTSPIYSEGRFAGAMLGSGLLGIDSRETCSQMYLMANGEVPEPELQKRLEQFPQGDSEKIKALAELMLVCAESMSTGAEAYHATLRRRAEQQSDLTTQIQDLKSKYPMGGPAPGYPLDKDRMLLGALRRGDNETGRKILNEILAVLFFSNPDQFKYIQFRAIELVVLLSRTDIIPGYAEKMVLETNNQYLRRIQDAQTIEELTDVLHLIVERMAGQIFSFQGVRHAAALRKAERFIWENYTRKISLQEIANASGLSAPYFSTIFKEEMGENLSGYLNRLRVEKASHLLTETDLSLSEIAGACGFEDQSWFSKIFKSYTGQSPGKYRNQGGGRTEISENNFSANYRSIAKK